MADLLSYALCTVADVKETLGLDAGNTSKDNLIKRKINQATEVIEGWCGLKRDHHFKETTYTNEELDGFGSDQITLGMSPVTSLSSFQWRATSQNEDSWNSVESELYFLDTASGLVDLLFSQTRDWNRYRVTYTAGYSTIPADLQEACITLAAFYVENATSGSNVKRKEEGQREIEYFAPTQGESIIEQLGLDDSLNRYKRYNLA